MLKNRIKVANLIFGAFLIILFFLYFFAVTTPTDFSDGSFRQSDFKVGTTYGGNAQLQKNDLVKEINGESLSEIIENRFSGKKYYYFKNGEKLIYSVERDGKVFDIEITLGRIPKGFLTGFTYSYIISFIVGLIGYIAFISSPTTKNTLAFLILCIAIGISMAPGMFEAFNISFPLYMMFLYTVKGPISGLLLISIPYFFLIFPTDLLKEKKTLYLGINLSVVILMLLFPFFTKTSAIYKHYLVSESYYVITVCIALGLAISLILNFLKTTDHIKKQQLKYLAFGLAISILPIIFLLGLPFLINREVNIKYEIVTSLAAIFPLTTLLAIRKYKLFEVRTIINKTFAYSIASLLIAGVSLSLFAFFATILKYPVNQNTIISLTPVLIFTAVSAIPIETLIENFLQKVFHRKSLEFMKSSEIVLNDLAFARNYKELVNYVQTILPNHLQVKNALLLLVKDDGFYSMDKFTFQRFEKICSAEVPDFQLLRNLHFLTFIQEIPAIKEPFIKGFEVIAPIINEDKVIAILLLGQKVSEDFYYQDEMTTISVISKQLGLSILNANLLQDLDEKAKKEKEVLKKEIELKKLKEEYITIVSHFLRTPITAAKGFIDLLNTEIRKNKTALKMTDGLGASIQKIHGIAEKIIVMSELEQGKIALAVREENLANIIKSSVKSLDSLAKEYSVKVVTKFEENPIVLAERNKLQQALLNIIENAILYNKPKGKVIITMNQTKSQATLQIEDTGRGIAKEELEKLFIPFHRAHFEKEGFLKGEGIGLGIYLTKLIIEAHNGSIVFDSKEGIGTKVIIKLPLAKEG